MTSPPLRSLAIHLALFFLVCAAAGADSQAQTMPDLSSCKALSDPTAYETGKISEGYHYIVPGKDGWLFRTGQDFTSDFSISPKVKSRFKDIQDTLAKKGTDIIFVTIPTRGIVASDYVVSGNPLAEGFDPKQAKASYAAMIADAQASGLNFVGITDYKGGEDFFFKSDHHWSSGGARQMAAKVAAFAKTLPSYKKLPKVPFATTSKGTEDLDTTFASPIEKLCGVKLPKAVNPFFETSPIQTQNESALFGDQPAPEVVLVGTSNSKSGEFHPNFDGFLKEYLQADLINEAITGGGLDDSILNYLTSDAYTKSPPKLIIWEIPGYYNFREKNSQSSVFNKAIPAAAGDCGNSALASSGSISLDAPEVPLFKGLTKKALTHQNAYFALDFSESVKKPNFALSLKDSTGKQVYKIKIKRSSRFTPNGHFFYAFLESKIAYTDSITLEIPKDMQKGTVQARICARK